MNFAECALTAPNRVSAATTLRAQLLLDAFQRGGATLASTFPKLIPASGHVVDGVGEIGVPIEKYVRSLLTES